MSKKTPFDAELLGQAFKDGGLLAVLALLIRMPVFWWTVAYIIAFPMTIIEAAWRPTTPSQYVLAFFIPAPLLIGSALGSVWRGLLFACTIGLIAGYTARDGGALFSYLIPNMTEAAIFYWLTKSWLPQCKTTWHAIACLLTALVLAAAVGALLGSACLVATVLWYRHSVDAVPLYQLTLHWLCGDLSPTLLLGLLVATTAGPRSLADRAKEMVTA